MTYLLLIIYLPICYWIMILILRRCKSKKEKALMVPVVLFLLYLPLGWDVILGRGYFYYYCSKQGGLHVYKTVTIDASFWDEEGRPKFIDKRGWFDAAVLDYKYVLDSEHNRYFERLYNIGKYTDKFIIGTEDEGEVLGEKIMFTYFGGWFMNYSGFSVGGDGCHDYISDTKKGGYYHELISHVLKPKTN